MTATVNYTPDAYQQHNDLQFIEAIQTSLSPGAVAMLLAYLQPCVMNGGGNEDAESARHELKWLYDTLMKPLGDGEFTALLNELGL